MPYTRDNVPPYVRKKAAGNQEIIDRWLEAWNGTFAETASEPRAFKAAAGAIDLSSEDVRAGEITCMASSVFPGEDVEGVYKVQVLRTGLWPKHPKHGDINVTNADLAAAVRNYRSSSRKMFLDRNHGITSGTTAEERKAIGWARDLYIETLDGRELTPDEAEASTDKVLLLFAEYEVTSPDAADQIRKKEYAFFSPTFYMEYFNEETGETQGMTVIGGAATNIPYLSGMSGFIAMTSEVANAVAGKTQDERKDEPEAKTQGEQKGAVLILSWEGEASPVGFAEVNVEVRS